MRSRAILTPVFTLASLAALLILLALGVRSAVHHTLCHLSVVLEARLTEVLGREVQIGAVQWDPWHGLELDSVAVARSRKLADGALLRVRRARVRYSLADLLQNKLPPLECVHRVELDEPWLYLARDARGRWNLLDLAQPKKTRAGALPARFTGVFLIHGGSMLFEDRFGGKLCRSRFTGIDVTVDGRAAPLYAAALSVDGQAGQFRHLSAAVSAEAMQHRVSLTMRATSVSLPALLAYLPTARRLPVRIEKGAADISAAATIQPGRPAEYHGQIVLRDGIFHAASLRRPLHCDHGEFELSPDALTATGLRLRAGALALSGRIMVLNFRRPWLRADLAAARFGEADVRAVFPRLPRLPAVRLGEIQRLEVALRGPLATPSARFHAEITSLARPEMALTDICLDGRLEGRTRLHLDSLAARLAGGTLTATGTVALGRKSPRYTVRGALRGIQLASLRRQREKKALFSGEAAADIQLWGEGPRLKAAGRLNLERAAWGDWHAQTAQADLGYRDGVITIQRMLARSPEGTVNAAGKVALKGPLQLQLAATELDLSALGKRFTPARLGGAAWLRGAIRGTYADPAFEGDAALYDPAYGADHLELIRCRVQADLHQLRLTALRGLMLPAQLDASRVTLVDPRAGADAELKAAGGLTGLDIGWLARRMKWQGDWGGTVDIENLEVSGPLRALQLQADITARRLHGSGYNVDYVSGHVTAGADGAVSIAREEPLHVRNGDSEVQVWGTIGADRVLDLNVRTARGKSVRVEDFLRLDPAVLRLQSRFGIALQVSGALAAPEIKRGTVDVQELVVNGNAFGLGNGEVDISREAVRISRFVLLGAASQNGEKREQYELDGSVWPRLDLTAVVQAAPVEKLLSLARLQRPATTLRGKITAVAQITRDAGQPVAMKVRRLEVTDGVVGPQPLKALSVADLALANEMISLGNLQVTLPEGDHLSVTGNASLAADGPLAFRVEGDKLALAAAQPWLRLPAAVTGVGAVQAVIGGTRDHPTLEGSVRIVQPGYGERMRFDSLTARLSYADGLARVANVELRVGNYAAYAEAAIPFDWEKKMVPPDGKLEAHARMAPQDLRALTLFSPRVLKTDGEFSAVLDVGGTLAQPDLHGTVNLVNGALVLGNQEKGRKPEEALQLSGINGLVRIEREQILVDHLYLASGKNAQAMALTGAISLRQFLPDQFRLKLAAKDYRFASRNLSGSLKEEVRFALDGEGSVSGSWPSPLVAGNFQLRRAKVDMPLTPAAGGSEQRSPAVNPQFAVHLATAEPVEIVAMRRSRVYANLDADLTGSLRRPKLIGKASATKGSVTLPTAHFRMKEAAFSFQMSPPEPLMVRGKAVMNTALRGKNPLKDPRGARPESFAVTANVYVSYPEAKPVRVELTAQPFLNEDAIYNLLTRKDVIAGLVSGQEDIQSTVKEEAMRYMANALQPQLIEPVERAIAETLGLSEFSIMASFEEPVEVKLGKYLVKDLRVSYTRAVSAREARYTFKVDYAVLDRVSLSWATDERRSRTIGLETNFQF